MSCLTNGSEEREMTRNQRGLVDTCFEEGQYESGIAALELLRSTAFKPPPDIIRQLLYIALYPPPSSSKNRVEEQEQAPLSPIKQSPSKQKQFLTQTSHTPSLTASEAAQRLLLSFISTNSPEIIFRGLPRYIVVNTDGSCPQPGGNDDFDEDSDIAKDSLCIKESKCCWTIIREGFIQHKNLTLTSQEGRKKRGRGAVIVRDNDSDNGSLSPPLSVAEHAWPVLHWLLSLFEKDECNTEIKSGVKYSPLLLSQIPFPRSGFGPRRDVDAPLDVVFCCLSQDSSWRRAMGTRLFTLLIHLTHVSDFDTQMFISVVTARLYSASPEAVIDLTTGLPKTTSLLTFQVALSHKYLSGFSAGPGIVSNRPKPQARARRGSCVNTAPTSPGKGNGVALSATRHTVASCKEILELVESQKLTSLSAFTMKYTLLASYALLQSQATPRQKDPSWKNVQAGGGLKRLIGTAFPDKGEGSEYKISLLLVCGLWGAT
ncbi:hypothetical protein J3A83DRAFT_4090750 [Scleroderma citrinum]